MTGPQGYRVDDDRAGGPRRLARRTARCGQVAALSRWARRSACREAFRERALALDPRSPAARVDAKWLLTEALINQNQIEAAGRLGGEVVADAAAIGRRDLQGRALLAVGIAQWIGPQAAGAEAALRTLGEARRLLKEVGDFAYLFEVVFETAFGDWADGRLNGAIAQWHEAAAIARSIPDAAREARATLMIARCHTLRGEADLAIEHLEVGDQLARRSGSRRALLEAAFLRAAWVTASRSPPEAIEALEGLLSAIEEVGDLALLESVVSHLAELRHLSGDLDAARQAVERALEISRIAEHGGRIPEVEATLANILLDMGRVDEAAGHAQRAVETAAEWDPHARATALAAQGRVLAQHGRLEEGERSLRDAVAIMSATEYRGQDYEVTTPLACFLLATGRTDEGERWLQHSVDSARRRAGSATGEHSPLVRHVLRAAEAARARAVAREA
jgi:tetratricopeptide (TPR) repeat protein